MTIQSQLKVNLLALSVAFNNVIHLYDNWPKIQISNLFFKFNVFFLFAYKMQDWNIIFI